MSAAKMISLQTIRPAKASPFGSQAARVRVAIARPSTLRFSAKNLRYSHKRSMTIGRKSIMVSASDE